MLPLSSIQGNIVDIFSESVYPGTIQIENGVITAIARSDEQILSPFIIPGFIDSHVHVESSLLVPSQFARLAVVHGTVGTVSDPHEIANVLGVEGVEYMLKDGATVPFHFAFGAPSCVPATSFETAGATINAEEIKELLSRDEILYLAEMMNYPGVLHEDPEVMAKIEAAKAIGKPIDGHAPGVRGKDAYKYIKAGISTDHESFTAEEAEEKLKYGMKILVREGSAAKNFNTLLPLFHNYPEQLMFCSDDKHPDSLVEGHINQLVQRSVAAGISAYQAIRMASKNPIEHYNLPCGLLRVGDSADMITVNNLSEFRIEKTIIKGFEVASEGKSLLEPQPAIVVNNFSCEKIKPSDLEHRANSSDVRVIDIVPGELITKETRATLPNTDGKLQPDPDNDILKLVVINRYQSAPPAIGYVKGFEIKEGAIASSVAHDSHNIVVAGTDDQFITQAVNLLVENQGGLSLASEEHTEVLPLPVAGLMSNDDGYTVSELYTTLDTRAKDLGSNLPAPFMTLSFLALLVIPELKLSDKGLFDGKEFAFISVEV